MHRLNVGPITRVEALEIPKLIDEVRADLQDPKIGILDPNIQLHGYKTMAELERALPKLLATLATGSSGTDKGAALVVNDGPVNKGLEEVRILDCFCAWHASQRRMPSPRSLCGMDAFCGTVPG